jgi:hypothetical protein
VVYLYRVNKMDDKLNCITSSLMGKYPQINENDAYTLFSYVANQVEICSGKDPYVSLKNFNYIKPFGSDIIKYALNLWCNN